MLPEKVNCSMNLERVLEESLQHCGIRRNNSFSQTRTGGTTSVNFEVADTQTRDYAFATDTPGDPHRKISMLVATDSIHGSIYAVVARRKGGKDDYVMRSFQKLQ